MKIRIEIFKFYLNLTISSEDDFFTSLFLKYTKFGLNIHDIY